MRYILWVVGLLEACDVTNNGRHLGFYQELEIRLRLVCYTAVFSVVTQHSSPQTAAENRTTFLSLCVCGLTNKPIMYRRFDNA